MPNLNITMPPREERDLAMGRYMDTFSRLEAMMQSAILDMLELDDVRTRPFFAALGTKNTIDVLKAAAQISLTDKGAERVRKLGIRIAERNMRRNHIVHGKWNCHVTPSDAGDGNATAEWIRRYDHTDMTFGGDPHDPKLLGTYTFTIPALDKATGHAEEMVQELSSLIADIPKLRPQPPSPEESFHRWIEDRTAPIAAGDMRLAQCRFRLR